MNTIAAALKTAADNLSKADDSRLDCDNPRFEAELLLSHVIDKPRSWLVSHADDYLEPDDLTAFTELLLRRAQGEPVAYLSGEQGFWHYLFKVSPAVLIPRPETELLVEILLEQSFPAETTLLDLGTGSGIVGICLSLERPDWHCFASDISLEAINIARENRERLGARVHFYQGSWGESVKPGSLDIMVSNPPYIADQDHHLAALHYEPDLALTSGADGMDAIQTIVTQAADLLKPGGILLFEHGFDQGKKSRALLQQNNFVRIETRQDLAHQDRVTLGYRPNAKE